MKKFSFVLGILVIILGLSLSACGTPATQAPPMEVTRIVAGTPEVILITATAPVVEEKPFRIAIVMPSSITDAAFSQSMFEGLKIVQAEMGGESKMEIAYSEGMFSVPDAASALRDYASQGFDLVIAHGSQYGTSLQQIAPEFPETSFAWGTSLNTFQADGINNVFAYQAEAQEGGYVLGVLAAYMSKSGIMGVCGPVEAGDAKLYVDGFVVGATVQNPTATVQKTYTGSFSDVALMASAAETHIQSGADMLTGSSQSVVGAIGIAKDNGAFWFGTQWDQTALAPDTVVASQVYDWTGVIKDMIASRNAGVLGNKAYTLTFKNGGLVIQYNPAIDVPAEAKAAADAAIQGIMDGTIDPLVGPKE